MKKLSYLILCILILTSCVKQQSGDAPFEREIYSPEYSNNFKISGTEGTDDVLISVFNPWQGAKEVTSELLVMRDAEVPESFTGQVLKGTPQRIITMSSTHIAMIDALGDIEKIKGVSGMEYISNPYIISNSKSIPDVGYEGNIDYEKIVALQPDLILLFSVNGASSMEPKLKELGIPYIYIGDYVEETPLGKTEWIIPVAEILGKREAGIKYFNEIASKYNGLKESISNESKGKPKVMVNAPFMDSWFMPSTESYIARMIEDAGGDYIYKKNTGNSSKPIDLEEALKLVTETDFWINVGTVLSLNELKSTFPKFAEAPCIKEGKIYNNNLRRSPGGGNDCYESGVVNPDLILRDMVKIFHPELVEEGFTYYHKIE